MSTSASCEVGISPVLLQAITQTLSSASEQSNEQQQGAPVIIEDEILTSEEVEVKCESQEVDTVCGEIPAPVDMNRNRNHTENSNSNADINMGSVLSAIAMKLQKQNDGGDMRVKQESALNPRPILLESEGQTFVVREQGGSLNIVPQGSEQIEDEGCPVCGDKISGYHYGIFSCESCKGFFKRTVQNKKNFVCHLQGDCQIDIVNRKKCPACRFKKCLDCGMKLEAIRSDRTRGGRSSYTGCSPHNRPKFLKKPTPKPPVPSHSKNIDVVQLSLDNDQSKYIVTVRNGDSSQVVKPEPDPMRGFRVAEPPAIIMPHIPQMLTNLLSVERIITEDDVPNPSQADKIPPCCKNKLVGDDPDLFNSLLHLADHCLYAIVRWARNLPYFVNVPTDDQILLLQNSWSELLCLSLCWHSVGAPPNELRLLYGRSLTLERAEAMEITDIVERLLAFVGHLRRLKVDLHEFVALKVLLLMTPDVNGLKNTGLQNHCQGNLLEALMLYTGTHYQDMANKIPEMLARLPEVSRIAHMGRERLLTRFTHHNLTSFTLLNELIKGDIDRSESS